MNNVIFHDTKISIFIKVINSFIDQKPFMLCHFLQMNMLSFSILNFYLGPVQYPCSVCTRAVRKSGLL